MKKGFTIGTLVGIGACALMLILSIFGVNFFKGVRADILLTTATLTAGAFFAISSINLLKHNKLIAYLSLSFIGLAVLLIVITIWGSTKGLYNDLTFTVATLSVLFNIIVSGVLKLQKKYLAVQLVTYGVISAFCILIILLVFNAFKMDSVTEIFFVLLILAIASLITISVISNRAPSVEADVKNYVKITKEEYEMLLEKAKKYDELKEEENRW